MKVRMICASINFYPRSPCGERQQTAYFFCAGGRISIHALLAESDKSTSGILRFDPLISIHALLAESDSLRQLQLALRRNFYPRSPCGERRNPANQTNLPNNFYPRSPCGERLCFSVFNFLDLSFLSTLSLRRATAKVHKTVGYFCAYETNFMEIASSC